MKKITKSLVTFNRVERRGEKPRVSCDFASAMHVFYLGEPDEKYTIEELKRITVELAYEQVERWFTGAVDIDTISPPIITEIPDDKFKELQKLLDGYNVIARNSASWREEWIPPNDFKVSENIIVHLVYCGLVGKVEDVSKPLRLMDLLDVENPCEPAAVCRRGIEEDVGVDSWSLYVLKDAHKIPRAKLDKSGGWNAGRKPKPPAPFVPSVEEKVEKKEFVNPLQGVSLDGMYHKETLQFMKKHGLNPVPLVFGEKIPLIKWKYLVMEPIKPVHLALLKSKTNIGVVARYNNVVLIDNDTDIDLEFDTTAVKTERGVNYIFYTDEPFGKIYRVNERVEGSRKVWDEIAIKKLGYILLPPSIHPDTGKPYGWSNKIKPKFIKASELDGIIRKKVGVE